MVPKRQGRSNPLADFFPERQGRGDPIAQPVRAGWAAHHQIRPEGTGLGGRGVQPDRCLIADFQPADSTVADTQPSRAGL